MAPETLDLNAHAKTFADTYAHARRTGADRPLAQRFGLADVLGEIEAIIADRVEKAVAEATSAHRGELFELRAKHANELAKLRPSISRSTISASSLASGVLARFSVESVSGRVVIRDRDTAQVADFGYLGDRPFVQRHAERLNRGTASKSGLVWDADASIVRTRARSDRARGLAA